jgi:hypothetical protein
MGEKPRYLTDVEVARITGRGVQTLRNERFKKCGISYCKIGKSIRYSLADVVEFMEDHKVQTDRIATKFEENQTRGSHGQGRRDGSS